MTEDKQKALYDKYPALFQNKDKSMQETCMCWGISCGDGWAGILNDMCRRLHRICETYDVQVSFDQVKEKFGSLRVYYSVKYGESWTHKPLLAFRILEWVASSKLWLVNPLKLWKKSKRFGPPHWMWTATHFLRRYNWKYKGKRLIEASRAGWSGDGLMAAGAGVEALISDAVNQCEHNSYLVCEDCGSTVDVTTEGPGWISTLCAECRKPKETK